MRHIEVSETKTKAVEFLKTAPVFCETKSSLIEEALTDGNFRFLHFNTGERIEIHNCVALVVSGFFEIDKADGKKSSYLKNLEVGGIVGIATLFDKDDQYISTLIAKKDSELLIIDEDCILCLIKSSPNFSLLLIKMLCTKIRYLNARIDTYTKTSAEEKLLEFLQQGAKKNPASPCVEMSMSSLSSALGVGRASLYRALNCLEEKGEIYKDGKKIFLLKEVFI